MRAALFLKLQLTKYKRSLTNRPHSTSNMSTAISYPECKHIHTSVDIICTSWKLSLAMSGFSRCCTGCFGVFNQLITAHCCDVSSHWDDCSSHTIFYSPLNDIFKINKLLKSSLQYLISVVSGCLRRRPSFAWQPHPQRPPRWSRQTTKNRKIG